MSDSELHPLAQIVSEQLNKPDKKFQMLVFFEIKPGTEEAFRTAFKEPLAQTQSEAGNIVYRLTQDSITPEKFIVTEQWKNLDALDAHLKQPYLTTLLSDLEGILNAEPDVQVVQ
ncbi:MAG: antibiotic biosynthesis monooxygenase [Planctomycetaceae bacterium]|nr:antibiotic biosynthesis monooxygenase [Planctomycetaceae bacterium]